jgi:hypothetical protein
MADDLGYHWRRAAGVYDAPDSKIKGNASTTTKNLAGLGAPQQVKPKGKTAKKRSS